MADATVNSDGGKTSRSAPASVLREFPAPRQLRPKPTFQKYTVVFLRYNGEIIRLNLDSAWLWDKLRTVVEARVRLPNGAGLAALRAVRIFLVSLLIPSNRPRHNPWLLIHLSLSLSLSHTPVPAPLSLFLSLLPPPTEQPQDDGALVRAANDIENGEYLNVEVRYDRNIYEVDDEYAVDARHMPRSAAKHAVAAAALHGHDRTQVTGHASGW